MRMFWSTALLLVAMSPLLPIAGCTDKEPTVTACSDIATQASCDAEPTCKWTETACTPK